MATSKATFTLDVVTLGLLAVAAGRQHKPKSAVVRDAIHDYHARIGRLGERERLDLLKVLDTMLPRVPQRPQPEVHRELRLLAKARRKGGRRSGGARA